jgi:hypothetical protein
MHRRARTVLAYAVATAAIAAEVAIFLGTRLVPAFVGASLASLWLHLAWRQALMKRFGPIDPTKEVA